MPIYERDALLTDRTDVRDKLQHGIIGFAITRRCRNLDINSAGVASPNCLRIHHLRLFCARLHMQSEEYTPVLRPMYRQESMPSFRPTPFPARHLFYYLPLSPTLSGATFTGAPPNCLSA